MRSCPQCDRDSLFIRRMGDLCPVCRAKAAEEYNRAHNPLRDRHGERDRADARRAANA